MVFVTLMARGELNWTVFVVDDDASVRKALACLLASAGYVVETFASAREFLDRGHHQDTPVVLCWTPGADGAGSGCAEETSA